MPRNKITTEDVPRLLSTLACGTPAKRREVLQSLCPCRNQVYEREVWLAIFKAYDNASIESLVRDEAEYKTVRNQAAHAIDTLREHSQRDEEAHDLLEWLRSQGIDTEARERERRRQDAREQKQRGEQKRRRVTFRDVPRLLETLSCGDPTEQKDTLELLCPCRNRVYDREVWLAIFEAYERGGSGAIRDQAGHAIGTLLERARNDPRSQDLVLWIAQQNITTLDVGSRVPEWRPNLRGDGLYIPRYEPSARSKANRRR